MIILGDIASPDEQSSKHITSFFNQNWDVFFDESILMNLEGLFSESQNLNDNSPILFNHPTVLEIFNGYHNKVAALANNHTLDLPHLLSSTKETLSKKGYMSIGAGNLEDKNFKFIEFFEGHQHVFVCNACWDFLLYHQNNNNSNAKVNTINENDILEWVGKIKLEYPQAKIVTYFHWSFDLEIIPSPSYRIFAKDLIDKGVSLVVGCHSHCVQGGEKYKDGYIVYGIGNFFLPSGIFANGKLKFPPMSNLGWALKWDVESNTLQNIWIDSSSNELKLVGYEPFENSKMRSKYSEYEGMSNEKYAKYFIENRRKNKLNPVFYNYEKSISNLLKMNFLKTRAKLARKAAKLNLIKWQN